MTIADWATTLSGFLSILIAFGVGSRWIFKKYIHTLRDDVLADVNEILAQVVAEYLVELKPNHGSSLNDKIQLEVLPLLYKLDKRQDEIKDEVTEVKVSHAKLEGRFEQYVEKE